MTLTGNSADFSPNDSVFVRWPGSAGQCPEWPGVMRIQKRLDTSTPQARGSPM